MDGPWIALVSDTEDTREQACKVFVEDFVC